MRLRSIVAAVTAVLLQLTTAAEAADKCAAGYKSFMEKISPHIVRVDEAEFPELMRRGLNILDACNAGDKYVPGQSWTDLVATAQAAGHEPASALARMILSDLPPASSPAYQGLLDASGNAQRIALPMSKAETWLVPVERVPELQKKLAEAGVKVSEAGGRMQALAPMASSTMTDKQSAMMKDVMSDPAAMGMNMMSIASPQMLEYALIRPADADGDATIELKLTETLTVTANRTDLVTQADRYIWLGEVKGSFEPVTLVYWPSGRLSGTVHYGGRIYKVQAMGHNTCGIIEIAPGMLPPEHAPMAPAMQNKLNMRDDPLMMQGDASALMNKMLDGEDIDNLKDAAPSRDVAALTPEHFDVVPPGGAASEGPVVITVAIAYTRAAARHYTDIELDLVALAIAEANQSFKRSGIAGLRIEVVHVYQTDYVEQGTHFEHMFRFAEKKDGYADEIHELRERYRADVAVMIVDDGNGCGLAAGIAPAADRAFAAVHHGCAATTYSLAHEIGHIIGARHDVGYDDKLTPFPFGHGYVNGKKWRTMMSYEQSCGGCLRLPVWSNPDVRVGGDPAGDAGTNNARAIREGARRVANFK